MSKIERLLASVETATEAAHAEMLRLYPVGSEIRFHIMSGQRNVSTGTVACVGRIPGCVRVRHHQAKERSRYAYRDVHHTQVLG